MRMVFMEMGCKNLDKNQNLHKIQNIGTGRAKIAFLKSFCLSCLDAS